jgi:nucleotidyltransferase AbiEii toxin of type IV toxin-antitoxin system
MVTKSDYPADAVERARSVLIEAARILGEYREGIVIVGGWVPYLLLRGHIGTTDVDLALNHRTISEPGYAEIGEILREHHYEPDRNPNKVHRFHRHLEGDVSVPLDLLAGEYGGRSRRRHEHQRVQSVRPHMARGCDLALDLFEEVTLEGPLPDGAVCKVTVRVASIPAFLVMKSYALSLRDKPKDAYDICFILRHHERQATGLAAAVRPHLSHGLVREALRLLDDSFASSDHVGPRRAAAFEEEDDPDEIELLRQRAFQQVDEFLRRLGLR